MKWNPLFLCVACVDWDTHQPHDEGCWHQDLLWFGPWTQWRHSGGCRQHLHVCLFPGETHRRALHGGLVPHSWVPACVEASRWLTHVFVLYSCSLAPTGVGSWHLHVFSYQVHEWYVKKNQMDPLVSLLWLLLSSLFYYWLKTQIHKLIRATNICIIMHIIPSYSVKIISPRYISHHAASRFSLYLLYFLLYCQTLPWYADTLTHFVFLWMDYL